MLQLDQIYFGAPQWQWPALLIVLTMLAAIAWSYRRRPIDVPRRVHALAAMLKIIAVLTLALCLLQPMRETLRPEPQGNLVGIVVDDSMSMQIGESGQGRAAKNKLASRLPSDSSWQTTIGHVFDIRRFTFDRNLHNVDSFDAVRFEGSGSSLATALTELSKRYHNRPVAGVILFSDGNATDLGQGTIDWSSLGFPVYPIVDPPPASIRDAWIAQVSASTTNFEAAPVTVSATVHASGFPEQEYLVRMWDDSNDKLVAEQTVTLSPQDSSKAIEFQVRPEHSGVCFYKLSVCLKSQQAAFDQGRFDGEATLLNNTRLVTALRDAGPYRILYVAGRPNWEFKFLRRALQEDDELQLVSLVRIARQEPKFSFRDRGTTDSTGLFSGFDASEEENADQYDEPVLLRLGVEQSEQLSKGFPNSRDELFSYNAIILDDIEAGFFTQQQMLLMREFVSVRGGGMLMLGGIESFNKGGYEHTPLADLMPVYVDPSKDATKLSEAKMQLTREGWLQPWLRLRQTQAAEQQRFDQMPVFTTINPVGHLKPGASELVRASGPSGDGPAVVVQRYGNGRAAAILIGDLWRWAMHQPDDKQPDLQQWWRQTTRWIIADVRQPVQIQLNQVSDPSKPIQFTLTVHDPEFLPWDNAKIDLQVTDPEGESFPIQVQASDQLPGVYVGAYWPPDEGAYRVKASVQGPDGSQVGQCESGWTTELKAIETVNRTPNMALLDTIAKQTGGKVATLAQLDPLARELPERNVPITQRHVVPLWHTPWVLALVFACLCGEWGLRRKRGMP